MTWTQLISACRARALPGESWSVAVHFWHHDHESISEGHTESLEWVVFRHAGGCQRFSATTPDAALEAAFPTVLLTEQMALVDILKNMGKVPAGD